LTVGVVGAGTGGVPVTGGCPLKVGFQKWVDVFGAVTGVVPVTGGPAKKGFQKLARGTSLPEGPSPRMLMGDVFGVVTGVIPVTGGPA
jgi:hypothetical protein